MTDAYVPAMAFRDIPDDIFIDANGRLAERHSQGDVDVVLHYDDVPESDVTEVDGLRVTTPLRTVIDLAIELDRLELERMIDECLARRLFTPQEAFDRVAQPDMLPRPGARRFAEVLRDLLEGLLHMESADCRMGRQDCSRASHHWSREYTVLRRRRRGDCVH